MQSRLTTPKIMKYPAGAECWIMRLRLRCWVTELRGCAAGWRHRSCGAVHQSDGQRRPSPVPPSSPAAPGQHKLERGQDGKLPRAAVQCPPDLAEYLIISPDCLAFPRSLSRPILVTNWYTIQVRLQRQQELFRMEQPQRRAPNELLTLGSNKK